MAADAAGPELAPRDELVIKVMVALRVPGVDVHDVIQAHRRYVVQLMQQWTRLKEDEGRFDLNFALVVDAELYRLDSVVRWLDAADGRLKRAALEPPPRRPRPCRPTRRSRSDTMSFLELHDVWKTYGEGPAEVHALSGVDLAVDGGELVAVMGASESGRSTLLTAFAPGPLVGGAARCQLARQLGRSPLGASGIGRCAAGSTVSRPALGRLSTWPAGEARHTRGRHPSTTKGVTDGAAAT